MNDLPAGVAGTLLDEKADMKDIIASIVDLARRGVMTMTETQEPGFLGIGTNRDFTFRLVDTEQSLRPYEIALLAAQGIAEVSVIRKPNVKILATDISTRTLSICDEGIYRHDKLETLSAS